MPETGAFHARAMLRWRRRALVPLVPFYGLAMVLFARGEHLNDGTFLILACGALVLALLLVLLSAPVIRHLFSYALRRGGPRYAASHAGLAALLVPVGYLGVLCVPPLVVADHGSRLPQWRRSTALGLDLEFLRFGGFLGALLGAGLLALIPGLLGLLLGALWMVGLILGTTGLVRRLGNGGQAIVQDDR